jgi:homoserine O-acetyltransferase
MHSKFGRRLQGRERFGYEFETEFQIESYLKHKGLAFTQRFDANTYLYITKALDYFDLSQCGDCAEGGVAVGLTAAFTGSAHVKFLVVSFTSDWLYPSYHSKELVSALTAAGADVTYLDIQSTWGHDAFLLEVDTMTHLIGSFMDRLAREEGVE